MMEERENRDYFILSQKNTTDMTQRNTFRQRIKHTDPLSLILATIAILLVFSVLSFIAAPPSIRFTWLGLNPWNSVQGVFALVHKYLNTPDFWTYLIGVLLILLVWWRMYAVVHRSIRR